MGHFANNELFGGLNAIAMGDLYQISPVKERHVFRKKSRHLSG